jgi:hypothetical protein
LRLRRGQSVSDARRILVGSSKLANRDASREDIAAFTNQAFPVIPDDV